MQTLRDKIIPFLKRTTKNFFVGNQPQKDWKTWTKEMKAIIFTLSTFYIVTSYGIEISSSDGDSMDPNIRSGDVLIIDKFFYKLLPKKTQNNNLSLQKGDIIVATQPTNPKVKICKRILQVGGGKMYNVDIPKRFYWVQGDNKPKSYDSRHHGALAQNLIQGRVITWIPVSIFSIQYWTKSSEQTKKAQNNTKNQIS